MQPSDKRKTPPVEGGAFQSTKCLGQTEHSTDPAPASMPQPLNVAVLDLFDATRISGQGPAVCLALCRRYRLGTLIPTPEGQVLRIHANRFRAAAIAEWGRRNGS